MIMVRYFPDTAVVGILVEQKDYQLHHAESRSVQTSSEGLASSCCNAGDGPSLKCSLAPLHVREQPHFKQRRTFE